MGLKELLGASAQAVLGRRNLFRLARMLIYRARHDSINNFFTNGEAEVQDAVLIHLRPRIVFDVGSNIGEWSAEFLRRSGATALVVHAFEPSHATCQKLIANIADKRLVPVCMACSEVPGTATLHIVEEGCGRNSLVAGLVNSATNEAVTLTTIDSYCAENQILKIDFLKIDAEGHDFEVLLGSERMLAKHLISVLQFEYNHRWIFARRYLRDAMELLQNVGYQLGKITPQGIEFYSAWDYRLENFVEGNYLACVPEVKTIFKSLSPEWLG